MTRCDVYELLSFLTNLEMEDDMLVPAQRVNRLEELLRSDGIRCDFSKQSFEYAAFEYPERFVVTEQSVKIKVQPKGHRRFVYYNSNKDVALKIKKKWQVVISEF